VLHIDFQRVDETKKIHMKVPLHFVNEAISPAVKLGGALISHVANDLDVACLPKDLPEFIEVDLSAIESGKSVHVSELKLPPGVTAITHGKDPVVAVAAIPKAHAEVEEAAEAEATAAAVPTAPAEAKPAETKGAGDKKEAGGKDEKKK
jgi:large subunit ribosomal protein L25